LVQKIFKETELRKLMAYVQFDNIASRKILGCPDGFRQHLYCDVFAEKSLRWKRRGRDYQKFTHSEALSLFTKTVECIP